MFMPSFFKMYFRNTFRIGYRASLVYYFLKVCGLIFKDNEKTDLETKRIMEFFFLNVYLFLEREREQGRGREREGAERETEKERGQRKRGGQSLG